MFKPIKFKKAIGDRLVVRRDMALDKTATGFIIPEMAKDRANFGVVLSAGPEVKEIAEGDHILFGKYSGTELQIGNEDLVIIRESEVMVLLD